MNFTKTMFALAIGSVGIMGAMSAHAVAVNTGDTLTINPGVTVYGVDASGATFVSNVTTSWFGMDTDGGGSIGGTEKTALSQGTTGIVIGTATTAGASHSGPVAAGDTNAITAPWAFFGNTGSDYTTVGITGGTTGLDFSGWTVTWNGIPAIDMTSGAWGTGFTNGVAKFAWDGVYGNAYTLDYAATVPLGDASGFGGVKYRLHLQGSVTQAAAVPEASTYGMMLAGLGLVGFAVRRKRV